MTDEDQDDVRTVLGYRRPGSYEEFRAVLSSGTMRFPKQLRQVAIFVSQNPSDIALGTVTEIARDAGVQPSALVRFAKSLGFPGFTDLQEIFKTYVKANWPDARDRETTAPTSTPLDNPDFRIVAGLVKASTASLQAAPDALDLGAFSAIADGLGQAETIYLIGSKRAFPVTIYMSLALSQLGIRNCLIDNVGSTAFEQIGFASGKDVVFAISFSPYNSITPALVAAAHNRGTPVMSISDSPLSPLVAKSRAWLDIREAEFGGFRSLAATIAVGMALVLAVAQRRQQARRTGARP